jgi:hypothetical protein
MALSLQCHAEVIIMLKKLSFGFFIVGLCGLWLAGPVRAADSRLVGTVATLLATSMDVSADRGNVTVTLSPKTQYRRWDRGLSWPQKVAQWEMPTLSSRSLKLGATVRVEMMRDQPSTAKIVEIR